MIEFFVFVFRSGCGWVVCRGDVAIYVGGVKARACRKAALVRKERCVGRVLFVVMYIHPRLGLCVAGPSLL